tara:strand:- start:599 stop:1093 length:495 start_codon:yes stop_codon:yes gene_type:complete
MTPEEKYRDLYEQMYELCEEQGWGDPFSYARSREIYMAGLLGHKVADDYAGEDAIDEDGGCEYKSTIGKKVNGTYNGISVQDTWEDQARYIIEEKIGKYENHYYARFDGGRVAEVWKLDANNVLQILLPKIKKQFEEGTSHKKDPRIGVSISTKQIKEYGTRIR